MACVACVLITLVSRSSQIKQNEIHSHRLIMFAVDLMVRPTSNKQEPMMS